MLTPHFITRVCFVGLSALASNMMSAQDYPNKPIRIVTSETGGGTDFVTRLVALGLGARLPHAVIVDNRSAVSAAELVSKAPADGYTLFVAGSSFWVGPLFRKVPYDPIRDFSPIALLTKLPSVLVTHPAVPAKSVKELIALAKAKPGELNYASASIGSANHLAAELFKSTAGVDIVHVPHKGSGAAVISLLGGQVQMMFPNIASVAPHLQSGKLKALAVTSAQPSVLAPGLPTVAATLPGFEIVDAKAMFGPRGTPAAVVRRLNNEVLTVLKQPDLKEKFFEVGLETAGSSPEELATALKSETARLGKVVKDTGLRLD